MKAKITFDKSAKQMVWQAIESNIENKTCPFCGVKMSAKNFTGATFIDGEFRAFDKKFTCLIALSDNKREIGLTEELKDK